MDIVYSRTFPPGHETTIHMTKNASRAARFPSVALVAIVSGAAGFGFVPATVSPASGQERPIQVDPARPMPTPVERADNLMAGGDVRASFDLLEGYLQSHPEDFEARWRAARAAVYMGILSNRHVIENTWYRRGISQAERALKQHPDDLKALRWTVAAEGSLALWTGAKETVKLAKDVYSLSHRMLQLDSANAFAYDALGTLNYRIMKLDGFKRMLGRLFLGGDVLAVASWHKALEDHRRAVALDPGALLYRIDLANTLVGTNHVHEAIEQLRVAVSLPERLPVDRHFHGLAERRLNDLLRVENGEGARSR